MNLNNIQRELEKCNNSPYYFATKYMIVNGKPFTTAKTEKEYNDRYKQFIKDK